MILIITVLVFVAVSLFTYFGVPFLVKTYVEVNNKRAKKFVAEMDRSLMSDDIKRVAPLYFVGPLVLGGLGFFLSPPDYMFVGVSAGVVLGVMLPRFYGNMLVSKRREMFSAQLVDALMIMSSSFRGGLSLIQSMEAVADEMPEPIRQEFSIVLGENKMGVTMDEAMNRLYRRMPSPSLQQMISAILLARETGGNLPVIFSRIVQNIRERRKIEENLNVLTIQGKIQALVMSGLPVGFFFMVNSTNPGYFHTMTSSETGRMLLMICLGLWIVGTFLIIKISSFKEF
ncbi:MAG: type II secretion system F family protein [Candidatus Omnitrophica bacterium]|nr:type II secretion system F family protein [Candidatus Omnitrophota bacterium]